MHLVALREESGDLKIARCPRNAIRDGRSPRGERGFKDPNQKPIALCEWVALREESGDLKHGGMRIQP